MKKLSVYFILGVAFVLFIVDNISSRILMIVRSNVSIVITPVLEVVSTPLQTAQNWKKYTGVLYGVYSTNQRLMEENIALQKYKDEYYVLAQQNLELRQLLRYNKSLEKEQIVARVISDTGGVYARTLLLNSGTEDGVGDGLGVMTNKGLLGRTVNTEYNNTRVLLLTDINSEIPVVVNDLKEYGILAGNVSKDPILKFVRNAQNIKKGQQVLTSGHGGIFPPGIPVGVISSVIDGTILVRLYARPNDSSYVRIVKFHYNKAVKKVID